MGEILLRYRDQEQRIPLSTSFRIGRHWSCDVCLSDNALPLYWIEIRWRENQWFWRALAAEERTKSASWNKKAAWSVFALKGSSIRIECLRGSFVEVQLVSDKPPCILVEDLKTKARYIGSGLETFVEVHPNGRVWAIGEEPVLHQALSDGDVFSLHSQIFRIHLPKDITSTNDYVFDVSAPEVFLTIHTTHKYATFVHQGREITIYGEPIRTLLVYAQARKEEDDEIGGWLTLEQAYENWLALGGKRDSKPERIAWERAKVRTLLAAQGVLSTEGLFEIRKQGIFWENRLRTRGDNILILQ